MIFLKTARWPHTNVTRQIGNALSSSYTMSPGEVKTFTVPASENVQLLGSKPISVFRIAKTPGKDSMMSVVAPFDRRRDV